MEPRKNADEVFLEPRKNAAEAFLTGLWVRVSSRVSSVSS